MDARSLTLLGNTLLLSGAACALSVPAGTLLAWLFCRSDLPGRRVGLAVVVGMIFVPLYLQAAAWQAGFGLQGWFTLATHTMAFLDGWRGAIWIHTLAAIPWVTAIVGVGMRRIERELEEQALLDGTAGQVFFRVTLRGSLPAVGLAALWVLVTVAGEMTVTDLFMIRTYAEEVYTQVAIGQTPDTTPPSVWGGIVLTAGVIVIGWKLAAGLAPRRRPLSVRQPFLYPLEKWKWIWAIGGGVFLSLMAGVPLGSLLYKAGVLVEQTPTGRVRTFSLEKCLEMIGSAPWRFRREFGWSLLIGGLAAAAAVLVGMGLAWWGRHLATRLSGRGRTEIAKSDFSRVRPTVAAAVLVGMGLALWGRHLVKRLSGRRRTTIAKCDFPRARPTVAALWKNLQYVIFNSQFAILLAIPGPILGLIIIRIFHLPPDSWLGWLQTHLSWAWLLACFLRDILEWLYSYSIMAPWLALFLRSLPMATLILYYSVRSIPEELLESAAVDGAGPWSRFWRVVVPLSWPAMLAAFFAALAVALGDLAASILTVPPGVMTLSIQIFNMLHYGVEDRAAGICLALIGVFALVAGAAAATVRIWQRRLRSR